MEHRWNAGAGKREIPKKPADQRHRPTRLSLAKIRTPGMRLNPVRLGGRRIIAVSRGFDSKRGRTLQEKGSLNRRYGEFRFMKIKGRVRLSENACRDTAISRRKTAPRLTLQSSYTLEQKSLVNRMPPQTELILRFNPTTLDNGASLLHTSSRDSTAVWHAMLHLSPGQATSDHITNIFPGPRPAVVFEQRARFRFPFSRKKKGGRVFFEHEPGATVMSGKGGKGSDGLGGAWRSWRRTVTTSSQGLGLAAPVVGVRDRVAPGLLKVRLRLNAEELRLVQDESFKRGPVGHVCNETRERGNTYDSNLKASIVERFKRTLKGKMWRYFAANGNYKWLDTLPKLVPFIYHSHKTQRCEIQLYASSRVCYSEEADLLSASLPFPRAAKRMTDSGDVPGVTALPPPPAGEADKRRGCARIFWELGPSAQR
ncbi:hypothetical protein PR048_033590 [Dryococelus australis]|uniref:Uncharacterized protein n=1 Tax=Dryococelus australis TaxID=614101 RepID=A0ABQ9G3J2_9NEOP|nr:hypothetical protein PR048_033590 [Dryococelus australis]